MLQKRRSGEAPPFDPGLRRRMWLALALGAPLALLLTLVETLLRSGGTVHLVARRREGGSSR
jgi:hypothetical protein